MRKFLLMLLVTGMAGAQTLTTYMGVIKDLTPWTVPAPPSQTIIVTPNGGNDLAVPIQNAVTACSSTVGCKIEVAPLTAAATLSARILITKSNVHLVCDSQYPMVTTYGSTTINPTTGVFYGPIELNGATNAEIEGCNINVSSLGVQQVIPIHVWGSSGVKVHNNRITSTTSPAINTTFGIRVEGGSSNLSKNVEVYSNFLQVPYIAVSTGDYGQYVNFHDNYITGCYQPFDFNGGGSTVPDSFGVKFIDNTAVSCTGPAFVESAADVTIAGNHFFYDGGPGNATIMVHVITSSLSLHTLIDHNEFIGNSRTGPAIYVFQVVHDVTITNNKITNMGTDGITVSSASGGSPANILVANNHIVGSGSSNPTGGYCGIRINQPSALVTQVNFLNNVTADDGAGTQQYGFCTDGASVPFQLTILGNNFSGTKAAMSMGSGCNQCKIAHNHKGTPPKTR
jgi:Right handed beta helix region